ncbi:MAG: hypothetical protein J6O56_01485 [Bacilli bacterium]|nr:hypothetical protein [Bacilli bacterium]
MSKKKVNKKSNNKKKLIICFVLVLLIVGGYFTYTKFFKEKETSAPKVVDEIKKFNYVVNEKDTKLFKKTFNELKDVLSKKEVDNKKYAETISKLFVIDFFNLDNKSSKNDVGGVQFVYNSYKSDFIDFARDGMYKQVTNHIDSKTSQNLPEVTSVKVTKTETVVPSSIFEHQDFVNVNEENAYEISLEWTYKNNDDFQNKAIITVVKDGDKLSIAKMSEE